MVASGSAVRDVPLGAVPSYEDFVRHLWGFRDVDGAPAVGPPPELYRIILDDPGEWEVAEAAVNTAHLFLAFEPARLWAWPDVIDDETVLCVSFSDLEALHGFLKLVALRAGRSDAARTVGEFLMWTLGFRWV